MSDGRIPRSVQNTTRFIGPRIGVACCALFATSDIFAMIGFREPTSWRWPAELAQPTMLLVGIAIVVRCSVLQPTKLTSAVRRSIPALVLVVLSVASVRWSIARQTTILGLPWLVTVTILGIAISTLPISIVVDGVALFGAIASSIGAWFSYQSQSFRYFNEWIGLFGTKNGFGAQIAFTFPFILVASTGSRRRRMLGVVLVTGTLVLLYKVSSRTSTVAVGLQLVTFAVLKLRARAGSVRPLRPTRIAAGLLTGSVSIALLIRLLGSSVDTSFSNRTLIWPELWRVFRSEWFHGFGANGFWSGSKGYLLRSQVLSGNASGMVTAHNGYLQEALALGVLGLLASISLSVVLLLRGIRVFGRGENRSSPLVLLVAIVVVVQNMMEAMFTSPQGLHWFLIVTIASLTATGEERPLATESLANSHPPEFAVNQT
jgi:O-antigen ligase